MVIRQAKAEDYKNLYQFLSRNYDCGTYQNWDVERLMFCRYATNNSVCFQGEESWFSHIKIWEESGEIVAFWHNEEQDQYFMQVSKAYKYLEEEILKDILNDVRTRFPEKQKIEISVCEEDKEREQIISKYGVVKLEIEDVKRRLVLEMEKRNLKSTSYHVIIVEKENASLCEQLAETYQYVWPESCYVPNGKVISDMLSDIDGEIIAWAVLDTKGQCVAYTMGFIDSEKEYAHLYPVAVRQEFLEDGVLELLLDTLKYDLSQRKIRYAVINAWYKPQEDKVFREKGAMEWKK